MSDLISVNNFRDLGGLAAVGGGRVRRGVLFRSAAIDKITDADGAAVVDLGVRTIYDLRSGAEVGKAPDPRLPGVEGIHLDVLADAQAIAVPAELGEALTNPESAALANDKLGDGAGMRALTESYRELVHLPSARTSYARLFRGLTERDGGALFHCTAGKDRTGWAAAALLSLLGVDRDDVYTEYLRTNDLFLPAVQPLIDGFAAAGGDADLLRPLLGAHPEYLDAAFDEVETRFGSIERYFADGLGIGPDVHETLRSRFLA